MFAVSARHTNAGAARVLAERRRAEQERKRKEMEAIEREEAAKLERERIASEAYVSIMAEYRCVYETERGKAFDPVRADEIVKFVADVHNVLLEVLKGASRQKPVIQARFDAVAAVKFLKPQLSLPSVGRVLGGKDHTTVLWALRKRGYTSSGNFLGGFPHFHHAMVSQQVRQWAWEMNNEGKWQHESTNESGEDQVQAGQAAHG